MYGVGTARSQARMAGLASGLDVEGLVEGMTVGVRSKITQQTQAKQTLQWKMDAYRSISSKMTDFSNKFLSYTSKSNMMTSGFYNSSTAIARGKNAGAVSVSGSSSSGKSLSIVGIGQTASTAGFISRKSVSNPRFKTGAIDFSAVGKEVNNFAGETINITYGGKNYDVKIDSSFTGTTDQEVADAFNSALANIEVGEETLADKISMSAVGGGISLGITDAGDSSALTVIGGSGKALAAIGISAGASTSNGSVDGPITGDVLEENIHHFLQAKDAAGKKFTIEYNGTRKEITVGDIGSNTREDFLAAVQEGIDKAFGSGRIKTDLTSGDELTFETVNRADGTPDTSSTLTMYYGDAELIGGKGILNTDGGLSNRLLPGSTSLDALNLSEPLTKDGNVYKMDVNGRTFEFSGDKTLQDVMDTINSSDVGIKIEYLSTTDRFSVTATVSGAHGAVDIQDFGSSNLASVLFGSEGTGAEQYIVSEGRDAEITISYDGGHTTSTLTRSSNNFDIDGLSIKLNEGVAFDPAAGAITFETQMNTDDLIKGITEMVNAYNEITDMANGQLTTKPDRKYYPLTSEMKKDMTEKEIEDWEQKANSGLLFGDSTLRSLASDMRFAFSFPVPGSEALSEFGISTGSSWRDNGKITIDEDKLRKAIEERPDDVRALFITPKSKAAGATSNDAGIMYRVKDVMDKYVATTGMNKGALINIAGIKDSYYESESRLYKQMDDIDKNLEKLATRQKTEEDRYYKQFTSLEKYISQMNMQSSWFATQ